MSDTFSVRLPKEQTKFLNALAKSTDRSRNSLISNAVAKMKDNYEFVLRKIEEGESDILAGRVVDNREAMRRAQAVIDSADKR